MSSNSYDQREIFTPPSYFAEQVSDLELQLPIVAQTHLLDVRLRRHGYSVEPMWDGITAATMQLELEKPVSITLGLDARDDDADPEVEMIETRQWFDFDRLNINRTVADLAVHIDPSPTSDEKSARQGNVAMWVALLLSKDLSDEDGKQKMIERFKTGKQRDTVASWVAHGSAAAGNIAVQAMTSGMPVSSASFVGMLGAVISTSLYRTKLRGQIKKVENDPNCIVELTDSDYIDEAEDRSNRSSALLSFDLV
ncbi:MAG: hypothetical protein QG628_828 [Patescibacteria group bacterium]|nr:hypothetical protein [Patescibacteria group bacterium]